MVSLAVGGGGGSMGVGRQVVKFCDAVVRALWHGRAPVGKRSVGSQPPPRRIHRIDSQEYVCLLHVYSVTERSRFLDLRVPGLNSNFAGHDREEEAFIK